MESLSYFFRVVKSIYVWILGISVGILLGTIFIASPIILDSYRYLPELGITNFDSIVLVGMIGSKIIYPLNFVAIFIIIYELLSFRNRDIFSIFLLLLNALTVALIFILTLYYLPAILEMQSFGASTIASPEFNSLERERDIIMCALSITFSINIFCRVAFDSKKPSKPKRGAAKSPTKPREKAPKTTK